MARNCGIAIGIGVSAFQLTIRVMNYRAVAIPYDLNHVPEYVAVLFREAWRSIHIPGSVDFSFQPYEGADKM